MTDDIPLLPLDPRAELRALWRAFELVGMCDDGQADERFDAAKCAMARLAEHFDIPDDELDGDPEPEDSVRYLLVPSVLDQEQTREGIAALLSFAASGEDEIRDLIHTHCPDDYDTGDRIAFAQKRQAAAMVRLMLEPLTKSE